MSVTTIILIALVVLAAGLLIYALLSSLPKPSRYELEQRRLRQANDQIRDLFADAHRAMNEVAHRASHKARWDDWGW